MMAFLSQRSLDRATRIDRLACRSPSSLDADYTVYSMGGP